MLARKVSLTIKSILGGISARVTLLSAIPLVKLPDMREHSPHFCLDLYIILFYYLDRR